MDELIVENHTEAVTPKTTRPSFAHIQEEIANMLDVPDEELSPEQKEAMDIYLDELGSQEVEKADSFAQFIRLESRRAEALKEESDRLRNKARTAENRIGYLKGRYLEVMLTHGINKVKGEKYTLSTRKSEAVDAPDDPSQLKALYESDPLYVKREVTYKADKKTIKEALKGGLEIPGCHLRENFSLTIR